MAIYGNFNEENEHILGTITFSEILNEDEVVATNEHGKNSKRPSLYGVGDCKISVYGGEGTIPHMHIYNHAGTFKSCVCLYTNQQFPHDEYRDILISKQCKNLDEYMRRPYSGDPSISTWKAAVALWKRDDKVQLYKDTTNGEMPDYRTMHKQPPINL